jgi:hypothetical protein
VSLGSIVVGLLLAGCKPGNDADVFPLSVGFQPLEPLVAVDLAAWPVATATEPRPQGLGPIVAVSTFSHYGSHARGYLHAPLAKVYEALKDPAASYIHNDNGAPSIEGDPVLGVEPFPVSFRVRYINGTPVGPVRFDVTYRAGPLEGTEAAPVAIGQRYQKTWGVESIAVLTGSLFARAVDGAPDVTAVEMIAWLAATTQDQADCDGTLRDLFGNLEAKLASMP